jgi:hypothetical protein
MRPIKQSIKIPHPWWHIVFTFSLGKYVVYAMRGSVERKWCPICGIEYRIKRPGIRDKVVYVGDRSPG